MNNKKRMLYRYLLLICTGFILVFSCEKDKTIANTCNVKNPTTDLQWMVNDIKFIEQLKPEES